VGRKQKITKLCQNEQNLIICIFYCAIVGWIIFPATRAFVAIIGLRGPRLVGIPLKIELIVAVM
jgi:hypothetical protein